MRRILLALAAVSAMSASAQSAPVPVKIEHFKPKASKVETMQFLKENRVFFRARLDALREIASTEHGGGKLSDRHLKLQELAASIRAAEDSLAVLKQDLDHGVWRESLHGLLALAEDLDALESMLGDQDDRLNILEHDFTSRQKTSLMVLISGYPSSEQLDGVALVSPFGDTTRVQFRQGDAGYLRQGGLARLAYAYVEPRDQRWELQLDAPNVELKKSDLLITPPQDCLTFLELNLDTLNSEAGALSITAKAWTWEPTVGAAVR